MQTAIEEVMEILKALPDDSSLEEIQHHIYVLQKIQKGIDDVSQGKYQTQEEVERRMEKWLEK